MRTWGRIVNPIAGQPPLWVEVTTDVNGYNDAVYITDLCQCLRLSLGEDPFFADHGIPAHQSVVTQIFPDFYTYQTQSQFAQFFVSLTVQKIMSPTPTYDITAVTHSGAVIEAQIPI